jgi:phage baseplate assembly protein W
MADDLAHWWDSDLNVAVSGDLLSVGEPIRSEQRLVRRLLTPPGSYIWHQKYGAGLAQYIGRPTAAATITAIVRAQLKRESAVASTPAPKIAVTANANGVLIVSIQYWNNLVGAPRVVAFPVGNSAISM